MSCKSINPHKSWCGFGEANELASCRKPNPGPEWTSTHECTSCGWDCFGRFGMNPKPFQLKQTKHWGGLCMFFLLIGSPLAEISQISPPFIPPLPSSLFLFGSFFLSFFFFSLFFPSSSSLPLVLELSFHHFFPSFLYCYCYYFIFSLLFML